MRVECSSRGSTPTTHSPRIRDGMPHRSREWPNGTALPMARSTNRPLTRDTLDTLQQQLARERKREENGIAYKEDSQKEKSIDAALGFGIPLFPIFMDDLIKKNGDMIPLERFTKEDVDHKAFW